jgi:hypothetical protein
VIGQGYRRGFCWRRSASQRRQRARQLSAHSITSEAGAILVSVPTLEGWDLLPGLAVVISCATGIYASLFSGLSRREGVRGETGIARIKSSRSSALLCCSTRKLNNGTPSSRRSGACMSDRQIGTQTSTRYCSPSGRKWSGPIRPQIRSSLRQMELVFSRWPLK